MKEVPHIPEAQLPTPNSDPDSPVKPAKKKPQPPKAPPVPPPLSNEIIASMIAQTSGEIFPDRPEIAPPETSHSTSSGMVPLKDVLANHPKNYQNHTISSPVAGSIFSDNQALFEGGFHAFFTEPANRQAMLRGAAGGFFILFVLLFLQIR